MKRPKSRSRNGIAALLTAAAFAVPGPAEALTGLAWDLDTGRLWVSDSDNGSISQWDPQSGQLISSFTPFENVYAGTPFGNNRIRDIAWDGSRIWAAYWTDPMLVVAHPSNINLLPSKLYAFDPVTGSIVASFTAPFSGHPDGASWDGASLWVGEEGDGGPGKVYRVDPASGQSLESFTAPEFDSSFNPRGLAWDGSAVWAGYQSEGMIRRLALDGTVLASFASPYGPYQQGLAFDGTFLWATGANSNTVSQVDPATGTVVRVLTLPLLPAVPEPSILALLAFGIGCLVAVHPGRARKLRAHADHR